MNDGNLDTIASNIKFITVYPEQTAGPALSILTVNLMIMTHQP
jgi:hypothetical protein